MDLSTAEEIEIACERCGRRYEVFHAVIAELNVGTREFRFDRVGQEGKDWMRGPGRLEPRGGPVTGRHRVRRVLGRDGRAAWAFGCGCGHVRVMGSAALRKKLEHASEARIRL
jgi:hypothetical protein